MSEFCQNRILTYPRFLQIFPPMCYEHDVTIASIDFYSVYSIIIGSDKRPVFFLENVSSDTTSEELTHY